MIFYFDKMTVTVHSFVVQPADANFYFFFFFPLTVSDETLVGCFHAPEIFFFCLVVMTTHTNQSQMQSEVR